MTESETPTAPQTTINVKPELVYGVFRKDCYDNGIILSNEDKCLQFSLLKLLGYTIIVGATTFKIPQLVKILKSRSVYGISRFSAYSELICVFNSMSYAIHLQLGFSVFGESVMVTIQDTLVVLAIFYYSTDMSNREKLLIITLFTLYARILL